MLHTIIKLLEIGLGIKIKMFGRITQKTKLNWDGGSTRKFLQKLFLSFKFDQTYLHQDSVPKYQCLSHPDQEAMPINAFSILWQRRPFYVFPLFDVTRKMLHKIALDLSQGSLLDPIGQHSHDIAS